MFIVCTKFQGTHIFLNSGSEIPAYFYFKYKFHCMYFTCGVFFLSAVVYYFHHCSSDRFPVQNITWTSHVNNRNRSLNASRCETLQDRVTCCDVMSLRVKHDAARGARGLLFTSSRNIWTEEEEEKEEQGVGKLLSWIELRYSALENRPYSDSNSRKMSSWSLISYSSWTALQTTVCIVLFSCASLLCCSLFSSQVTRWSSSVQVSSTKLESLNVAC